MKTAALCLAAALVVPTLSAPARAHDSTPDLRASWCQAPAHWGPRHDSNRARVAVTTRDGDVTLILTDDLIALQLSNRRYRDVLRDLKHEEQEEEGGDLGAVIKSAVMGSVRALLNHSAECDIADVRDVSYRDGRLVFTSEDGDALFGNIDVDDQDLAESFSADDARLFVREFRRLKARGR